MTNKKMSLIQRLFVPSVFDLIVIFVFVAMSLSLPLIRSYDIWWHLKTGELLLNGIFPTQDIFSFTALGKPWILHEWGSEVVFAFIYQCQGVAGLILFRSFIFALVFALTFNLMLRKKINIFACITFILFLMVVNAGAWTVRPHMFTNLFLIILFRIYVEYRHYNNYKILRILPILFLVWINMHGGFIIGLIFLGVCIGAELINTFLQFDAEHSLSYSECKRLVTYFVLAFAACFINPNTYEGVLYPFMYLGGQIDSKMVMEWDPPTIRKNFEFIILVILILTGFIFQKKRLFLYEIFLILVFLFFAFSARRHVSIFTLIAIPIVAPLWQNIIISSFNRMSDITAGSSRLLSGKISEYFVSRSNSLYSMEKQLRYHTTLILIGIALILSPDLIGKKINMGLDTSRYPIKIVEHIQLNNIKGNIFNQYAWGGFLIWSLPNRKVFIDGRMDVYQKEISDQYFAIIDLKKGWEEFLRRHAIEHIVVKKDKMISKLLTKVNTDWIVIQETENAYLFSKK